MVGEKSKYLSEDRSNPILNRNAAPPSNLNRNAPPPPILSTNTQAPPPPIINNTTFAQAPPINEPRMNLPNETNVPLPSQFLTLGAELQNKFNTNALKVNSISNAESSNNQESLKTEPQQENSLTISDYGDYSYNPAQSDGRKMKVLFWDKMNSNQIQFTIWPYINRKPSPVDLRSILELFEDKKEVKTFMTRNTQEEITIDFINDFTRSNQINIAVVKLLKINKLSWPKIHDMINNIDETVIGYTNFVGLMKICPDASELEKAKAYKDEPKKLSVPSRWVYELRNVQRYAQRIKALILKKEFEERYPILEAFLKVFFEICILMRSSRDFGDFLRICLDAGNILNTGKSRGNSYGFKVSNLKEFISCKSQKKGKLSLMEYILSEIVGQSPNILNFIAVFDDKLRNATSMNIEDVMEEILSFKGGFNLLRKHLENAENSDEPDQPFITKFEDFFGDNGENIVEIEDNCQRIKEYYIETMIILGEKERKLKHTKSKEFLTAFHNSFRQMLSMHEKLIK